MYQQLRIVAAISSKESKLCSLGVRAQRAMCISNQDVAKMLLTLFSLDNFYIDEGSTVFVKKKNCNHKVT